MCYHRNPDCPHWQMEDLMQEQAAKKMHLENRQVGIYPNEPITQEQYFLEMNELKNQLETLKKDSRYQSWKDWSSKKNLSFSFGSVASRGVVL